MVLIWGLFFALSLALAGWLVYRSEFFPKMPGLLLMLSGTGYLYWLFTMKRGVGVV